ncbi:alpha-glucosidase [Dysgonomonas sp. 216]|uniref:glycoside hydrolase family 97 protein n=1 Tax=Dysgonomonas sp. 216 TaxID=2302934 RepID=UPI0013D6D347|nr:glycoside hydrolase family 97 protein [Dysgonomonas sp. 216]NDW17744.1 alpha-glucosidase [Dysgonomonas sp. 216]
MTRLNLFLALFCLLPLATRSQTIIESTHKVLASPDGNYEFTFYQKQFSDETKQMYYTVSFKGKSVIEESELGVLIESRLLEAALAIPNDDYRIWGENLDFIGDEKSSSDQTWKPVYGERSEIRDNYNEIVLKFKKGHIDSNKALQGDYDRSRYYMMNVVIRAYNEGVAFRYFFPEATNGLFLHIVGEQSQFTLPEGTMAYYERWAQGPYLLLPLKNWTDECERPLTMKLKNGLTVALAEAEMVDYVRGKFRLSKKKNNALQLSMYGCADVITPYLTPWRVIMAAEKPVDLINNNDLILNLNPSNKIKDTSWIKPGKVIRSGLSQSEAIACVDFAAERGLQYVHLDAGWYGLEKNIDSDATKVHPDKDIDFPALTSYAASKGIGIFVYVNQRALYLQLDEILPLYKKWGIKGIKFGFVQIGNQHWSTWLHNAVKKCAEYEMLVDVHDEYRPTGFSRTYPNLLTQEGIRGNEEMPDATHNSTLPFTRFLAGAGDYTICYYNDRIKTTHAHQLAMAAVYYSPLQFIYWYDKPSMYNGEPEIEFFDTVKAVWDDTKALDGEIGEFVTIARRSNTDWFLGTLGNNNARRVETPLLFLTNGQKYVANIYTDDDAIKTKTKVKITRLIVSDKDVLQFNLKPSGGCAVHFTPATKTDLKKYKSYKKNQQL